MQKNHTQKLRGLQGHPNGRDNLIDFPTSSLWAEHYYQEGYSDYRPPKAKQSPPTPSQDEEELSRLRDEVWDLRQHVQRLQREQQAKQHTLTSTRNTKAQNFTGIPEEELFHVR